MVTLGIDRIGDFQSLFAKKKIGLITNYSGVNSALIDDVTAFIDNGYSIVKLFTPEHGLFAAMDGAAVDNSVHPTYPIPIVSLYGQKIKPTEQDLEGVELLVYDIQDVGLRYYTYIYTLANCMMAAAEHGLPLVVLDRPNPLADKVGGNRMRKDIHSFVGDHELALRYGLTIGELGYYFKQYLKLDLEYMVLTMQDYKKSMKWPETKQLWNLPSPSIHTFQTTLCYYGGCFFEATNISEGRGTAEPFQIYGAPFIKMDTFVKELKNRIHTNDLAIRERAFTPFWSKHASKTCFGVEFIPLSDETDFLSTALITMKTIKDMYPDDFEFVKYADVSRLHSLAGDDLAEDYLNDKLSLEELLDRWQKQTKSFEEETEACRIYE